MLQFRLLKLLENDEKENLPKNKQIVPASDSPKCKTLPCLMSSETVCATSSIGVSGVTLRFWRTVYQ